MCAVSYMGDYWKDQFPKKHPWVNPGYPMQPAAPMPGIDAPIPTITLPPVETVKKEDFEALRKEVMELKELLKAAIKYDKETGEPDCHMDEKIELIKQVAKYVGVDLKDVFK